MRAFCGEPIHGTAMHLAGNPCRVQLHDRAPDAVPALGSTVCATWPLDERRAAVNCWSADGSRIAICGHGMLVCAALWNAHWGTPGELVCGDMIVRCEHRPPDTWLGFPAIAVQACEPPQWLQPLLGVAPVACARAGGPRDYLVAELERGHDLTRVSPPGVALGAHTERALVVTCRVDPASARSGEDIHYRYFAPQYGTPEDTATGSAMRVMNEYWRLREGLTRLTAVQCSPRGGLLRGALRDGRSWVGGACTEADCE